MHQALFRNAPTTETLNVFCDSIGTELERAVGAISRATGWYIGEMSRRTVDTIVEAYATVHPTGHTADASPARIAFGMLDEKLVSIALSGVRPAGLRSAIESIIGSKLERDARTSRDVLKGTFRGRKVVLVFYPDHVTAGYACYRARAD